MGNKNSLSLIAVGGFLIVIFFIIVRYPNMVLMDAAAGATLFQLFPGLIVMIVALFTAKETNGAARAGSVVIVGVAFAYLLNSANGAGLITAEMLSGLTVAQLQIWSVILGTIFGAIAYAAS